MESLGLLFMILGLGILRQVSVGRAVNIPTDAKDAAVAVFRGKFGDVSGVTSRRGVTPVTTATGAAVAAVNGAAANARANGSALATAQQLGAGKPYVWGATGPNGYDCSGLVWAALRATGQYTGPRFVTQTFGSVAPKFATRITASQAQAGDIVIWPSHHMGFVAGPDLMFSAYNRQDGIITSRISAESGAPEYWRLNA